MKAYRQLIVLFIILIVALYYSTRQISKKNCVGVITVIMSLFSGLRTWWYGDLVKYCTLYVGCTSEDWREVVFKQPTNLGIRLFFRLAGYLGISYDVCVFMIAVFSAAAIGLVIYRYSPSPYFSYLMYITIGFYLFTFSGLKQTIAMGFLSFAMCSLIENRRFKFLIWVIVAGMFHTPALVFLLAYPLAKNTIDLRVIFVLVVGGVAIVAFRDRIVEVLSSAYYADEMKTVVARNSFFGGRAIMMVMMLIAALFLRKPRKEDNVYYKVYCIMILAFYAQIFSAFGSVFTRLADYFFQYVVLFVPLMLEPAYYGEKRLGRDKVYSRDNNMGIILGIGITLFALWFFRRYTGGNFSLTFRWELDANAIYNGTAELHEILY